jgi:hypothetical protein
MITGNYFITPHAVRKFQERIARLPYDEALGIIAKSVSDAPIERHSVTQNGRAMSIRVASPFDFRAVIAPGHDAGAKPAVVTILKSGKPGRNRKKLDEYLSAK